MTLLSLGFVVAAVGIWFNVRSAGLFGLALIATDLWVV